MPRTSRLLSTAVALVLAVGAPLAVASPALADRGTAPDATGDVARADRGPDADQEPTYSPAPDRGYYDVTRVVYDYGRRFLVVKVRMAQRVVRYDKSRTPALRVRAGADEFGFVRGEGIRVRTDEAGTDPGSPGPLCRGGTITEVRRTLTMRVPARCFGTPRQARFGLVMYSDVDVEVPFDEFSEYDVDVAAQAGPVSGPFTAPLVGPVRRG